MPGPTQRPDPCSWPSDCPAPSLREVLAIRTDLPEDPPRLLVSLPSAQLHPRLTRSIEAAALAAALAENALESERKERTAGHFEHTPE
jgi:hypothetical protein